jgi:hypothetical protein
VEGDGSGWDVPIQRFRDLAGDTDAGRVYIALMEGARSRWELTVTVDSWWRLDVLTLTSRHLSPHTVFAEYRVRDGEPIVVFRIGTRGSMDAASLVTADICRLDTAPTVLDAFLLQIAEPAGPER